MNPNYDEFNDFFGIDSFDCLALEYLALEWMINVNSLPHKTQRQVMEMIALMRGKDSPQNTAGKVAMEVITLGDILRNPTDKG